MYVGVGVVRPYTLYSSAALDRTSLEPENAARNSAVEMKKNITMRANDKDFLFIIPFPFNGLLSQVWRKETMLSRL